MTLNKTLAQLRLLLLCTVLAASAICSAQTTATESLYGLDLSFRDDKNQQVLFANWKGKWVITSMLYLTCKASCPLTMQKLKTIESALRAEKRSAEFVLVSFDAERDSPKDLAQFKAGNGLDDHWHFLTGTKESVRSLSFLLSFSYQKIDNTEEFNHSNRILLLDPDGVVKANLDRLSAEHSDLVSLVPVSR